MLIIYILLIYFVYNLFNIKKNIENNYSIDVSIGFKAIAVILIFFGHILQRNVSPNPSILEIVIRNCGFIGVSIFLFNSGYGYSKKYNGKNINFTFLCSHIFKILFPYLIVLILYNIIIFRNNNLTFLIPYSWYVFAIIIVTILYYICGKIKFLDKNISLFILTFILSVILYLFEFEYYVISQLFTFAFGCFIANKKIEIKNLKISYFILIFFFVLFYILYLGIDKFDFSELSLLQIIIGNIASCLIAFLTYLLGKKIIFKNEVNIYLNKVSYWFYLCQSISVSLLFNYKNFNSNFLIILSIVSNFVLVGILDKIFGKIEYNIIRKIKRSRIK